MGAQLPAQHRVESRVQAAEAGEVVDLPVVVCVGKVKGRGELRRHVGVEAGFPGGVVREEGDDGGLRSGYEGVGAWRLCIGGYIVNDEGRGSGGGEGGESKG